jgi:hypothetical protein
MSLLGHGRAPAAVEASVVARGPSLANAARMRSTIVLPLALALSLAACGDGGAGAPVDAGCDLFIDVGECTAPPESLPVEAPVARPEGSCWDHGTSSALVVTSAAEWDASFGTCAPVPAGIDFATQRLVVAYAWCQPIEIRFVAETAAEVVVGVRYGIAGICLDTPLVVTLPRSTKPIRVASCNATIPDGCPPIG